MPFLEIGEKMANALDVSLDYLVGTYDTLLDKSLVQRVADIQKLPDDQKNIVTTLLDAFFRDFKAKQTYS